MSSERYEHWDRQIRSLFRRLLNPTKDVGIYIITEDDVESMINTLALQIIEEEER